VRSALASVLLGGSFLLVACQPTFSVPDGVTLTCSGNDKCPSGYTCSAALGRCIHPGDDGLPLNVTGTPAWNTTTGSAGSILQVTFSVSKSLGMDPLVQLQLPKDNSFRPFALVHFDDDKQYVYAYRVTGDEGDGAAAVTVKLVDTFGKVADAQPLGSEQLVFTAIGIAAESVKITPAYAASGTIVHVQFKPTVAGTTVKSVHIGSAQATASDPQPTDGTVDYQFGIQGGVEGPRPITTDLVGPSGKVSPAIPVGTVVADFTPPTVVTASTVIDKSMTHPGDTETVTVTLSEPLSQVPQLDLGRGSGGSPLRFTATILSATQYRYQATIRLADVGTPVLTLSLATDLAGNIAPATQVGVITVANTKPAIDALTSVNPKAFVTVGDVVKVSFTALGTVQAPDVKIVLVSGESIALAQESTEPFGTDGGAKFVFSHTVASADPQGGAHVDVRLTDLFGNKAGPFSTGQFIIDRAAPVSAAGVIASPPSPLSIGTLLVVTVNADKILGQATLTSTPALTFSEPTLSGTAAIWTHTVTAADTTGAYSLNASIRDRAGNTTAVTPGSVTFDTVLPSAVAGSWTPAFATVGTVVRAAFDVTETLAADPVVSLGSAALPKDAASAGTHYIYTHVVTASDPQRALPLTVELKDLSGNENDLVPAQVNLDFSLVQPSDIVVSPASATVGDTLTVVATAHRALGTTQTLTVDAPAGLTFSAPTIDSDAGTVTWTHVVTAGDTAGPVNLTVSLSDQATHAFPIALTAAATIVPGT
jgi:hypothetical protein